MKLERLIGAGVLLAVLAGFGAAYQFYFAERLASYAADRELKEELERVFADLESSFSGVDPDVLTRAWRAEIQPWASARTERAEYFNYGDWLDYTRLPQDGTLLRFWYEEESSRMIREYYQRVAERLGDPSRVPPVIDDLNVPVADDWAGQRVQPPQVRQALTRLSFGLSVYEMLLDARATSIGNVEAWPVRDRPDHNNLLRTRTVGVSFTIPARELVSLVENLRTADRFFTVEAIRITYPYIAYQFEPQLRVEMLFSKANFIGGEAAAEAADGQQPGQPPTAAALFEQRRMEGLQRDRPAAVMEEPGVFGRAWQWFRRHVLYLS